MRSALLLLTLMAPVGSQAGATTLEFSGYTWRVREAGIGYPGPNQWDPRNAWVDDQGRLHLRISHVDGAWQCAEVFLEQHLGFGTYQFKVVGRPDLMDPSVVLGLFNYTRPPIGPDGTNEIDIEFTQWGQADAPRGYWTVYPAVSGRQHETRAFPLALNGEYSTHRFRWSARSVEFQMLHGHRDDDQFEVARWKFMPVAPRQHIPQSPLPVHLNLWLFNGRAPTNPSEVEIIISEFRFIPERPR